MKPFLTDHVSSLGARVSRAGLAPGGWLVALALALAAPLPGAPSPDQPVPDRLDLKTALTFALDNNFAIRQARERIRQQEGLLVEVRARSLPNVSAGAQYSKTDRSLIESFTGPGGASFSTRDDDDWSASIEVRQAVFAGGGVRAGIRSQSLSREAALLDLQRTINDALLQVRERFFGVLLAREQIKVREQALQLAEDELKTARDRFDVGSGSRFDVLRAEVTASNARPPLIRARNGLRLAIEELRQDLGFTTRAPESLTKTPEFIGDLGYIPQSFELSTLLSTAQVSRPELQGFEKQEAAQAESVRVARSGYYPSLDVVAGYQLRKSSLSSNFDDTIDGWTLGLVGNWAIFDGRATAGRVVQARSRLEQTRLSRQEQELAIAVEVRRAYSSYQEAYELWNATGKAVESAEEAVRQARARFSAGSATQLDVLQTQVALTEARTNHIQALHDYNVVLARLRRAIGQGGAATVE